MEEALFGEKGKMIVCPKVFLPDEVFEIDTYEDLRALDQESAHSSSVVLSLIARKMAMPANEIKGIKVLKKGTINRSFCFTDAVKKYIMRIPGEGTELSQPKT